jgi:myo-inositol 2-dehydrogenase/D-chiro-inositol 1-dehydrogenase
MGRMSIPQPAGRVLQAGFRARERCHPIRGQREVGTRPAQGVASLVNAATSSAFIGGGDASPIPSSWRVRFGGSYHAEIQEWISGLLKGETVGPSAWDGYAATRVAEAGVEAVRTGQRITIDYIAKPVLYA